MAQDESVVRSVLLQGCMTAKLDSASAASNARLLLALVMRSSNPVTEFGSLISALLRQASSAAPDAANADPKASPAETVNGSPDVTSNGSAADDTNSSLEASRFLLMDALVSP